jgi:hypothetical protein
MTVDEYLASRGVTLPLLECDDWAHIAASTPVGEDITKLWLDSRAVLEMCHEVRSDLTNLLVRQCDIWYFG